MDLSNGSQESGPSSKKNRVDSEIEYCESDLDASNGMNSISSISNTSEEDVDEVLREKLKKMLMRMQ